MQKEIVFAGGCFWGIQEYFRRVQGVLHTTVGYAQGTFHNPSYENVKTGNTLHAEVCSIVYDDTIIKLEKLLNLLFRVIDPTELNHQGGDYGTQYRTGIYFIDQDDEAVIQHFIQQEQQNYAKEIVVQCEPLIKFYTAEEYHQEYLVKNINGYCHIDFHKLQPDELKDEFK